MGRGDWACCLGRGGEVVSFVAIGWGRGDWACCLGRGERWLSLLRLYGGGVIGPVV